MGKKGFASEQAVKQRGHYGTRYHPTAAYGPWQKGRVEREIATVRNKQGKAVIHCGLH